MLRTTVARVILLLIVFSWLPGVAEAVVTLSIPDDLCAEPGATDIDVPIQMENDVAVRGLQFTLRDTPDDLSFDQIGCTTRTTGFQCDANDPGDNGLITLQIGRA